MSYEPHGSVLVGWHEHEGMSDKGAFVIAGGSNQIL